MDGHLESGGGEDHVEQSQQQMESHEDPSQQQPPLRGLRQSEKQLTKTELSPLHDGEGDRSTECSQLSVPSPSEGAEGSHSTRTADRSSSRFSSSQKDRLRNLLREYRECIEEQTEFRRTCKYPVAPDDRLHFEALYNRCEEKIQLLREMLSGWRPSVPSWATCKLQGAKDTHPLVEEISMVQRHHFLPYATFVMQVLEYANEPFMELFEVSAEDLPPPGKHNRYGNGRWISDFVHHDTVEALNKMAALLVGGMIQDQGTVLSCRARGRTLRSKRVMEGVFHFRQYSVVINGLACKRMIMTFVQEIHPSLESLADALLRSTNPTPSENTETAPSSATLASTPPPAE